MGEVTPFYRDDWLTVYHGNCREVMASMPAESVHCVVTSPPLGPYWGLRDYGTPGQLGLEPTPEEYVANLVAVFREVRRVLRADGTVWLNLGDSYSSGGREGAPNDPSAGVGQRGNRRGSNVRTPVVPGLKPKDLVGIPWRVAFALQADGWYLRSDIIWAKPNPMPESVTDRPTKSHEYIFLLSKSPRYYFDADAVRERSEWVTADGTPLDSWGRPIVGKKYGRALPDDRDGDRGVPTTLGANVTDGRRNIRSVWTMATQPYPGAHFATFPETLPERCIKAGTSEKGVCPECGAPWERVVERAVPPRSNGTAKQHAHVETGGRGKGAETFNTDWAQWKAAHPDVTTGWRPSCAHVSAPVPAQVLDCFAGSGTTGMVAQSLSRRAVLIDLSLDYLGQLMARNVDIPLGLGA